MFNADGEHDNALTIWIICFTAFASIAVAIGG